MGGIRLGSILGFEIRLDYSWFIIFFLVLWTFGFAVFPRLHPGQPTATYMLMALSGALLFFGSIIAHELSHSLVARRKGITVSGITLFVFGGMAHASMNFEEPSDEFQIAAIGPISSFLIAALFQGLALIGQVAGWPVAVVGVASYLAFINLALAIFNLLPGFPLDGGRIFRSAVWKYTGDLRRATRYATSAGKGLGYALIAIGLLNFFARNPIGGLWLIFIGWFVRNAAESSYTQLQLQRSLQGVRADEAMTPDPYVVPAGITLDRFVDDHLFRGRHSAYPVVADERPVGIITLDRVRKIPRDAWPTTAVADAMLPITEALLVGPEETMDRVLERLAESETGKLLVTREGSIIGIITRADIARWLERIRLKEGR